MRLKGKLVLLIVVFAAVWGAWALAQRESSDGAIPIDAKFVRREVRYEAI